MNRVWNRYQRQRDIRSKQKEYNEHIIGYVNSISKNKSKAEEDSTDYSENIYGVSSKHDFSEDISLELYRSPSSQYNKNGEKRQQNLKHKGSMRTFSKSTSTNSISKKKGPASKNKIPRLISTKVPRLKFPKSLAKAWVVADLETGEVLAGVNVEKKREIASLTKMMTCLIACEFADKYNVDINESYYIVSKTAADTIGTSAQLNEGDYLTLNDLLFGLMLPSGNDAATAIAENIVLHEKLILRGLDDIHENSELPNDIKIARKGGFLLDFYKKMNSKSRRIGMSKTNYASPHGLSNSLNYSCAIDQIKLLVFAMKHNHFAQVIGTKSYTGVIERNDQLHEIQWKNTHRLLSKTGYIGGKTGITPAAKGCLASIYQTNSRKFACIVLGCDSAKARFDSTDDILSWVVENEFTLLKKKQSQRIKVTS